MDEQNKQKNVEELKEKVDEISKLDEISELIKNNEAEFTFENIKYRVRRATFKEKQEVYKKRVEKYTALLQDDKYLLEADLKQLYLKRNINIDALDKEINLLAQDKENLMLKLGEALKNKAPDNDLTVLKKEIEKLNLGIQTLFNKKNSLLEFSIESQTLVYAYTYLTYLITEKLVIGKDLGEGNKEADIWVRAWTSYEEYEKASEKLVNMASYFATLMGNIEADI